MVPTSPLEPNGRRGCCREASHLYKTDNLCVPVSHRAFAVRTSTRRLLRKRLLRPQRGNAMRPNLGTFVTALLASTFATAAWAQDLGRVHFDTSCTPQAQEKFDRGLAMVHSFFYPNSIQAFTEATATDPQYAIASWGIAISHRPNPLILPLTTAVLKNELEAVGEGQGNGAKSERERDWLDPIQPY